VTLGFAPGQANPSPSEAIWFTMPFDIKSLRILMSTNGQPGSNDVGNVTVKMTDTAGVIFSGTATPVPVGNASVRKNGDIGEYVLDSALSAGTTFIISVQQDGTTAFESRWLFWVEPQ
jgi:hypothetical protein